ncbi:dihydrofolate reductase family protein [Hoeflea sp.]|uniref:dihydrofolate reductase family protein n=1 Tax=Hoeflea sp. TaxID=1940281 RepID=UPI003B01FC0C
MQPIIYDVAVSLDGFISGPGGDISQFAHDGPVVDDYAARLSGYSTAIMGRKTYEFGYAHGLAPGMNPYPHMETFVFSQTLSLPDDSEVSVVTEHWDDKILDLKSRSPGPVYLCGGGALAGRLLEKGAISQIILKRAPCIFGDGVTLFGGQSTSMPFNRLETKTYDNGYLLERFAAS